MNISNENTLQGNFDEMQWLNNYYGYVGAVDRGRIEKVLLFLLMWNLFESETCEKDFAIDKINKEIDRLHTSGVLKHADFSTFLKYFQRRYSDTDKFEALRFRAKDFKPLVERVLKEETKDIVDVVLAIIIIVYRLRNNMFHGEKAIVNLQNQVENFSIANQVIARFLDVRRNAPAR